MEHWEFNTLCAKLDKIIELLQAINQEGVIMAHTLDEVLQTVTDESTVADSLVALVSGLKTQLDSVLAGNLTPAQQAQVDSIFAAATSNKDKLEAAVVANSPSAP